VIGRPRLSADASATNPRRPSALLNIRLRERCSIGRGATALRRGVALLFLGLILVLSTPWCSETWSYLKPDAPQITDSCEARVATQDKSSAATTVLEELMVIGPRVRCSSPSGT
jgi:hypothetical protein